MFDNDYFAFKSTSGSDSGGNGGNWFLWLLGSVWVLSLLCELFG